MLVETTPCPLGVGFLLGAISKRRRLGRCGGAGGGIGGGGGTGGAGGGGGNGGNGSGGRIRGRRMLVAY